MSIFDYQKGYEDGRHAAIPGSRSLLIIFQIVCWLVAIVAGVAFMFRLLHFNPLASWLNESTHHTAGAGIHTDHAAHTQLTGDTPGADALITTGIAVRGEFPLPAGTGLYRVSDLKYPFNKMLFDTPTTWFTLSAKTCARHPGMDCSQPVAIPDNDWKPSR